MFVLGEFLKNSIPVADFSKEFPVGSEYITREYADWLKHYVFNRSLIETPEFVGLLSIHVHRTIKDL